MILKKYIFDNYEFSRDKGMITVYFLLSDFNEIIKIILRDSYVTK